MPFGQTIQQPGHRFSRNCKVRAGEHRRIDPGLAQRGIGIAPCFQHHGWQIEQGGGADSGGGGHVGCVANYL